MNYYTDLQNNRTLQQKRYFDIFEVNNTDLFLFSVITRHGRDGELRSTLCTKIRD